MYQIVPYLGDGVLTLADSIKRIDITRLNSMRLPLKMNGVSYIEQYWVYPDGAIQFMGGSNDAKANSYKQKFIIAGVISQPAIQRLR
jgi:hypothetical protein